MSGEEIAKVSLEIGSIKLRPNNPYLWASGYRMPIYNDNRMLLGNYEHRILIANELKKIVEKNNISFDYVAGIPTAGIAPAASLAQILDKPLIIYDNGEFLEAESSISDLISSSENSDLIASTCPYAIPMSVRLANNERKPFIYVRQNNKDHGMERKIEGIVSKGQRAFLVDLFTDSEKSYLVSAMDAIYEVTNAQVGMAKWMISKNKVNVDGKKLLVLEDLISTGSSSIKEIIEYRKYGAIVEQLLSIFNYGFPEVNKNFIDEKISVNSALYYDTLLKIAKQTNYINSEQEKLLADWRLDPFNWGEKHGFIKGSKPLN